MKLRAKLKAAKQQAKPAGGKPFPLVDQYNPLVKAELLNSESVEQVEVDDPEQHGAKVLVFRSIASPLEYMRARGQIDDAQYQAGKQLQEYYEQAEIGGVRGIDITKEFVDGGRMAETLTEKVQRAVKEIQRLERKLGQEGTELARHVLCGGFSIRQCAEMRGADSRYYMKYTGIRFREVLETLAREMNLVSK